MRKLLLGLIGLLFAIPVFATCPSGQVEQTYTTATGTVVQNGTPTPTNPIEPIFYTQGNMVLRKINDTYADSYDATTGKITRRVGVITFNGNDYDPTDETGWHTTSFNQSTFTLLMSSDSIHAGGITPISTHFVTGTGIPSNYSTVKLYMHNQASRVYIVFPDYTGNVAGFKQWLSQNPVTLYYPLKEANWYTEDWTETSYCQSPIKIATTAYNSARFSPVVNDLNDTIATIRDVVTNTINQTKAIADLQATKQTRPDENCPAGKKCLLVEDNDGTPHWYEIIENAYGLPNGYTALEYIESTGTQYIDTGLKADLNTKAEIVMRITEYSNAVYGYYFGTRSAQTNKSFILGTTDGKVIQGTSKFFTQFDTTNSYPVNRIEYIDLNKHTFELSKDGFYQDGGLKRTFGNPTDFTTDRNVVIFGADDPVSPGGFGYSKVAVYSFKMWESGVMVRDFVPAKNSSGVIGMYDTVSGRFFTNAGSGTFTAGPEI